MAIEELVGPAPRGWEYTTLSVACEIGGGNIQTGPFGSQLHAADYVPVGVPVIMPRDIGDNRILEGAIARITAEDAERLSRYLVRSGDIVYSRRGDVERRALVRDHEDGWLCGTGCLRVRLGDQGPDPRFATYYFGHPGVREWIVRHAHGATMPNLNTSILGACPFIVPPPSEQRAIANVLGALDDKIELNRRMSETLEAMARALFRSWFVDFDPIRAKAEGRDASLTKSLADLFPARLVDSELGKIPEGWKVAPLSDLVEVARGLSYTGSGLSSDGVPMHNLNSINEGGGYKHGGLKHYDGEYKPQHVVHAGDLIVANTEQGHERLLIGYPTIVPKRFGRKSIFSQDTYRVRPREDSGLSSEYLCHLLCTTVMHDIVSGYANGTTVNHLPVEALQVPPVLVPAASAVDTFSKIAAAVRERHEEMVEEARTLAILRDTLLPRLISGELRVNDAERIVDGAAS